MDDKAQVAERSGVFGAVPLPTGRAIPALARLSQRRSLLGSLRLSIRDKILLALMIVVGLMSAPYIFLIVPALQYKQQYDAIIENITTANSINGYVKLAVDAETWNVVVGKEPFAQSKIYSVIDDVDSRVAQMIRNTDSQPGRLKLDVIRRTLSTLRSLEDRVGLAIAENKTFNENMVLVEKIRDVSALVEDNMQDYALFEVKRTEQQYNALQAGLTNWGLLGIAMMVAAILFSIAAAWRISRGIYVPIKKLHDVTRTIAQRDLEVLVTADNADEIAELGMNFNIMVGRIRELVDAKIMEQENLKKAELRVLQAQINPHFLYNTLDAIIWMAETKRTAQVVDLVRELSRFFRITLSKGKDWITVREEFDHVESYLAIQKIRYSDILDYRIDVPDSVLDGKMLKLTLQPLVENALYHGIKNKRSGGVIVVRSKYIDEGRLLVEVEDNGIGMSSEKLETLRAQLDNATDLSIVADNGFGINNVNQRIKLYYGQEYGLTVASEYLHGTRVSLVIPLERNPSEVSTLALGEEDRVAGGHY